MSYMPYSTAPVSRHRDETVRCGSGRSADPSHSGPVFSRVKKQMVIFPNVRESGSFLDEFACEVLEYDDDQRSGRFVHPETMPDDALHATNYALLLGVRAFQGGRL